MKHAFVFSVLVIVSLAGCTSNAPPTPQGTIGSGTSAAGSLPPDETTGWGFAPSTVAIASCYREACFEPTVAADAQGRLFASDGTTSSIAVSEDSGLTWTQRDSPPIPGGLRAHGGDIILQVSPTGRLYWSALMVLDGGSGAPVLAGIHVAWSDDGAKTWGGNVHIGPAAIPPTAQVIFPDRQWLAFAPDGTMYVSYNQVASGIWLARSTDGGATWSGWNRAITTEQRPGGAGQSGPPVVTPDGSLLVFGCTGPEQTSDAGTLVARSKDHGVSFEIHFEPRPCNWFPIGAVAPNGDVVLANQPGNAQVAYSKDGGVTFASAGAWGSRNTQAGIWPLVRADETMFMTWFADDGSLHVTRGNRTEAQTSIAIETGKDKAATDYANAALLPDGRLATIWSEGKAIRVAVTTGR